MLMNDNIPDTHKANQILWFCLMAGVIFISALLVYIVRDTSTFLDQNRFLTSMIAAIGAVISLISALFAKMFIRKKVEAANPKGLKEKFADFRGNFILNAALHEGPAMICAVFMMLEQNFYFIILVLFNVFMLYTTRPTIEKFKQWYSLTNEENQQLKALNLTL